VDGVVRRAGRDWRIYCVSAGRAANVPAVQTAWHPYPVVWVVQRGERADYEMHGAQHVVTVRRPADGTMPLGAQRNAALDDAAERGVTCVQSDDDVKRLLLWRKQDGRGKAIQGMPELYLDAWADAMATTGARLAGCAPLPNPFYSDGKVKTAHWVMAQLFAVDPGSTVRFDPDTCPREDYDFTCRHLTEYGIVARCDELLPEYRHWGNAGGCQDYRTDERSARINALLLARWPQYLRPNPRRDGELLLKVRS